MEKPILFNADMVRAILDRRKTVTRRVVTFLDKRNPEWSGYIADGAVLYGSNNIPAAKSSYQPGDILYVRETWCEFIADHVIDGVKYAYRADTSAEGERFRKELGYKWHPSIHMPREAARIWLRVTNVRVERLQDSFTKHGGTIFEIRAEGINIPEECRDCIDAYGSPCCIDTTEDDGSECGMLDYPRSDFADLWDSTIKPVDRDRYGWTANPWVWVIEFERCEKPQE